ncbi:S8 family serine peptidase, partial [Pseudokordiimonas caeni]|uniref:S8 family serine peptidase n=1 Tax=Pseudokordiimonas caeni TaxID=2997908 RepID=UPI0028115CB7
MAGSSFKIPHGPFAGTVLPFNDPLLPFQANVLGYALQTDGSVEQVAHINVVPVWDEYSGKGVLIGTTEQPEMKHPDLAPNAAFGTNSAGDDSHDTLTTSIFGAAANNGIGIVGIAWCADVAGINAPAMQNPLASAYTPALVMPDVVNFSGGSGTAFAGIEYIADMEAAGREQPLIKTEHERLENIALQRGGLGSILVHSAGNLGNDDWSNDASIYSSNFEQIQVGMTNGAGEAVYSGFGANVHITAPLVSSFRDQFVLTADKPGNGGAIYSV